LAGLCNVNEVFGRAVGDDLIRQVSALIRETVHPDAFLAREQAGPSSLCLRASRSS
jgi:GGDEF domain-containing protein